MHNKSSSNLLLPHFQNIKWQQIFCIRPNVFSHRNINFHATPQVMFKYKISLTLFVTLEKCTQWKMCIPKTVHIRHYHLLISLHLPCIREETYVGKSPEFGVNILLLCWLFGSFNIIKLIKYFNVERLVRNTKQGIVSMRQVKDNREGDVKLPTKPYYYLTSDISNMEAYRDGSHLSA